MISQEVVIDHRVNVVTIKLTSDQASMNDLVTLADDLENRPDITTTGRITYAAPPEPPPL